ncbi:MAG: Asp-tRNA(Asn)/Glu-tRNA(Gln) amidotransferase subunit GatB [Gemmataceae bacterium]
MSSPAYHIVIGLETHVQLLTRTKLFCGCSTRFGQAPNSATCPVCAGLPGSLPVMNRRAFELSVKAALALNCRIAEFTKWDRKNYYYPDLPKNYQISQYDLPLSHDGWLEIDAEGGRKRIGIIRAHLEEDAGKMLHDEQGGKRDSLVDLNRTGTPLLEIVSRPELSAPEEAKAYLEELRLLLRELEISDCEMQEGSLRCDANINIHVPVSDPKGRTDAPLYAATPLIEVKNLNSFRAVERAMKYEADRQAQELERRLGGEWELDHEAEREFLGRRVVPVKKRQGDKLAALAKATAGWDDRRGVTEVQRRKEEASDYRYFPEPDLAPLTVSASLLLEMRESLGELPAAQLQRLQAQYGLSAYDAGVVSRQGRAFVAYVEQAAGLCGDAKEVCNWAANDVLQYLNEQKVAIGAFPISPFALAELIKEVKALGINRQRARDAFGLMLQGKTPKEAVAEFRPVGDESQLREMIVKAIAANAKAVADYKKGKTKAADAIKGAVMRETKGRANTELVQKILLEELAKT